MEFFCFSLLFFSYNNIYIFETLGKTTFMYLITAVNKEENYTVQ